MADCAQRRIPPLFLPHLRQLGGASRLFRRFDATKFAATVAVPVFPAVKRGSNFRKVINFNESRNLLTSPQHFTLAFTHTSSLYFT
jgi:hypothetical protein